MFLRHILLVKFQCSVALQDVVCTMCSKTESNGEEVRVVQDFGGVLKGDFCVASNNFSNENPSILFYVWPGKQTIK